MSSTNKTPKLSLSQFLGTDKPAWLGDYNSDMQKIDEAFANLEQGGQSSAADIATLQQKDVELEQSITDVNDRVDTISTDLITVGNRTTVLEGNYDTMHHELVLNEERLTKVEEMAEEHTQFIDRTMHTEVHINANTGNDDNDGLTVSAPMKTILGAYKKYHTGAVDFFLGNGEYNLPSDLRTCTNVMLNSENNANPRVIIPSTILAKRIYVSSAVTLVADNNVTVDINNIVINGAFLVNAGYTVNINDCHLTVGNNGKLTGEGKIALNRSFVVFSYSSTVIDVATLVYASSMVMDKDVTVTSTVTNARSIIASELTV